MAENFVGPFANFRTFISDRSYEKTLFFCVSVTIAPHIGYGGVVESVGLDVCVVRQCLIIGDGSVC